MDERGKALSHLLRGFVRLGEQRPKGLKILSPHQAVEVVGADRASISLWCSHVRTLTESPQSRGRITVVAHEAIESPKQRLRGVDLERSVEPNGAFAGSLKRPVALVASAATNGYMTQPEMLVVLRDVLEVTRLATSTVTRAELAPPWGFEIDPSAELAIHIVQRGSCWLHAEGHQHPMRMGEGDVAFIRHGVAHGVTDAPDSPRLPYGHGLDVARDRALTLSPTERLKATRILCAKYSFQPVTAHPLIGQLPPIALIRAPTVQCNRQLHLLTQLLDAEADEAMAGDLLLPRLIDGLLILVLRAWISEQEEESSGWVSALRNPEVARALSCLHQRPHEPWTVERLAQEVGQSRATLSRRFVSLVGEPPASYLARWRMSLAAHLLSNSDLSIEAVASKVGYESAAALSKAFRRTHGVAPGRFRTWSLSKSQGDVPQAQLHQAADG